MASYIWCEDSKSGFTFWTELFRNLFPKMVVESKKNNSGLVRALRNLEDTKNNYYIIVDGAPDNEDVLRCCKELNKQAENRSNVTIITVHSFEFALLSFNRLVDWVFTEDDELRVKREALINQRTIFVEHMLNNTYASDFSSFRDLLDVLVVADTYNTEKISARLLKDITRNTGFETDKRKLGDCFYIDCCKIADKEVNDVCGLDDSHLSSLEKMKIIFNESVLKDAFAKAGLLI